MGNVVFLFLWDPSRGDVNGQGQQPDPSARPYPDQSDRGSDLTLCVLCPLCPLSPVSSVPRVLCPSCPLSPRVLCPPCPLSPGCGLHPPGHGRQSSHPAPKSSRGQGRGLAEGQQEGGTGVTVGLSPLAAGRGQDTSLGARRVRAWPAVPQAPPAGLLRLLLSPAARCPVPALRCPGRRLPVVSPERGPSAVPALGLGRGSLPGPRLRREPEQNTPCLLHDAETQGPPLVLPERPAGCGAFRVIVRSSATRAQGDVPRAVSPPSASSSAQQCSGSAEVGRQVVGESLEAAVPCQGPPGVSAGCDRCPSLCRACGRSGSPVPSERIPLTAPVRTPPVPPCSARFSFVQGLPSSLGTRACSAAARAGVAPGMPAVPGESRQRCGALRLSRS